MQNIIPKFCLEKHRIRSGPRRKHEEIEFTSFKTMLAELKLIMEAVNNRVDSTSNSRPPDS